MSKAANVAALEELKKHGMKVEAPSKELDEQLRKFGEIMVNEWVAKAGDDGKAIIDAFRK